VPTMYIKGLRLMMVVSPFLLGIRGDKPS